MDAHSGYGEPTRVKPSVDTEPQRPDLGPQTNAASDPSRGPHRWHWRLLHGCINSRLPLLPSRVDGEDGEAVASGSQVDGRVE